jgi:extracellular elastinolytic metalloproteinase
MVREIDARESVDRLDDARREELHDAATSVSDDVLPGHHRIRVASFDAATGNAAVVVSDEAAAQPGDFVARAIRHVQSISPALGLTAEQAPEYAADPTDQTTSTGAVAVNLRQLYKGIAIYDASETVRFGSDGTLLEVAGRSIAVPGDVPLETTVSPEEALRTAAAHVAEGGDPDSAPTDQFGEPMVDPGLDLSEFAPALRTSGADKIDRPTTFDAPPFQHVVTVALMWFPLGDSLRLCWHTKLAVPDGAVYRILVDANDGRILFATRLTQAIAGRADVVLVAGGAPGAITMPLAATAYGAPVPADLPVGFPADWLVDSSTRGASVEAVVQPAATPVSGTVQSGTVVFSTAAGSPDNLAVNLFALCSSMHDLLYLLGFRESDGNFQVDNFGRGGRAADPVLARVHPGSVYGTANMGTPPDGSRPTMNMGLVTSTNRHTALDADVVFHEYTHGLTNRLVGGPLNDAALEAVQSGGMGEGWSDYFACVALGKNVVGDWVVNRPTGIRKFRYDESFPDTYADLGTGRYADGEPHNLGEIWCATLMSLARQVGTWTFTQIVVDALKLTSANPSFLAARDAILLSADHYAHAHGMPDPAVFVHTVWQGFARYGMGPGARTDGANVLTGIIADFEAPPAPTSDSTSVHAEAQPRLAIPDYNPSGVVSVLTVPDAGSVTSVVVTVDITHTYIGDLVITLVSPTGATVPLHDRAGGGTNDLKASWNSDDIPELADLLGVPAGGQWTLTVVDKARQDVGSLEAWSLDLGVSPTRPALEAEAVPGLVIPDNKAKGITSELALEGSGTISRLTLELDITHTYISDLKVVLAGPDGTKATVHNRKGGGADNVIGTFDSEADGVLAPFVGKGAGGTWVLTVADYAGQDIGKLNRWRLVALT